LSGSKFPPLLQSWKVDVSWQSHPHANPGHIERRAASSLAGGWVQEGAPLRVDDKLHGVALAVLSKILGKKHWCRQQQRNLAHAQRLEVAQNLAFNAEGRIRNQNKPRARWRHWHGLLEEIDVVTVRNLKATAAHVASRVTGASERFPDEMYGGVKVV